MNVGSILQAYKAKMCFWLRISKIYFEKIQVLNDDNMFLSFLTFVNGENLDFNFCSVLVERFVT